jgi:hypothetical protein
LTPTSLPTTSVIAAMPSAGSVAIRQRQRRHQRAKQLQRTATVRSASAQNHQGRRPECRRRTQVTPRIHRLCPAFQYRPAPYVSSLPTLAKGRAASSFSGLPEQFTVEAFPAPCWAGQYRRVSCPMSASVPGTGVSASGLYPDLCSPYLTGFDSAQADCTTSVPTHDKVTATSLFATCSTPSSRTAPAPA